MKFISKKSIIGIAAGIAILAGTMSPVIAQAGPMMGMDRDGQPPMAMGQPNIDHDKMAQRLSATCGVDQKQAMGLLNEGVSFRELSVGAFVAKASSRSLQDVMNIKMNYTTWQDEITFLGVTKETIKATHDDMVATLFAANLDLSKDAALNLLQKGYHARDIAVANELAHDTDKSITDVLAMKMINNTWQDVATTLGVADPMFKEDMKNVHAVMLPHSEFYQER
jgi:hypothetical protein